MNGHLCMLLLVSLAVLLVKSESRIEVDEKGDEYEVKRFNIPGRKLNEGRSQCVEVRRKRAVQSLPQPLYHDDVNENDDDESDNLNGNGESAVGYYSPPVISSSAAEESEEDKKDADSESLNEMHEENLEQMTASDLQVNKITKSKGKGENERNKEELPVLGHLQSADESSAAVVATSNVKDEAHTDGIVIVQSHKPPKVNPQTHAVFELRPVEDRITQTENKEEGEDDNGESDFDYIEELTPFSTTYEYVWSTGDDNSDYTFDDYDQKPLRKKPKRKTKYRYGLKSGLRNGNDNQNGNKNPSYVVRPVKTQHIATNKTKAKPVGSKNRRPNSNKRKATMDAVNNRLGYYNNSNNSNNRNRVTVTKKKNRKNAETFIRPNIWVGTEDDNDNDHGNEYVNCIIIRKETPTTTTTTPRPFWNFWRRRDNSARQASGYFGNRKRADLRFVA